MTASTILRVDSSIAKPGSSSTRQLTQAVVDAILSRGEKMRVVEIDLFKNPIPHLQGQLDPANKHLLQFKQADTIVIGAPMYNFSIPSQLKAWIDQILVSGQTFRYGPNGPEGLAGGKRVVVVTAAGGIHGKDSNFVDPYLRSVLSFIGIKDARFVQAHGMAMEQVRASSMGAAMKEAAQISF